MLLSKRIKIAALCYLRFDRQFPLVATEAGPWNADVIGVGPVEAIELEIKVSKADLLNDMKKKKRKHGIYLSGDSKDARLGVPNKFYFLVPEELEFDAVNLCKEEAPKYGVLVYREQKRGRKSYAEKKGQPTGQVTLTKKAFRLHNEIPSARLMDTVLARSSSELCRTYKDLEQLHDKLEGLENELV